MPGDGSPTQSDDPPSSESPSLIDRIESFEGWRNGAPGSAPTLPLPPANGSAGERTKPAPRIGSVLPPGWGTEQPPAPARKRRRFRWTVLVVALLAALGVTLAIRSLPGIAESRAETRQDGYEAALTDLEAEIPSFEAATGVVTDPASTAAERSLTTAAVAGFRNAALSVAEIADEPLPSTPPFVPRSSIEALQPMRTEMVLVAGRAELISSRVERALLYRATADKAFELGALPDQATGDDVEDISLDLAGMLAASVDTLTTLPSDSLFDDHRRVMQATFDYLREWQIDYLAALRRGNRFRAELLAEAAHTRVDAVQASIGGPLAELDSWVENEINGLRRDITGVRILAP